MDKSEATITLESIVATLNEVNATLGRRYAIVKGNSGSWVMRARGLLDAMEIVESMRQRVMMDVVAAIEYSKAQPVQELPAGLTILSPDEVAARESKPQEEI